MAIVTVRSDLTWEGVPNDFGQNEKGFAKVMKELTGAVDVEVIERNCWDDDDGDE